MLTYVYIGYVGPFENVYLNNMSSLSTFETYAWLFRSCEILAWANYCLYLLEPFIRKSSDNGILLPKLFWPTVRKKMLLWLKKTFEIRGWGPRICNFFEITRTIYYLDFNQRKVCMYNLNYEPLNVLFVTYR